MRLNLVPKTVKSGASLRTAIVTSVLLTLLAAGATAFMAIESERRLVAAKEASEAQKPRAARAVEVAKAANAVYESGKQVKTFVDLHGALSAHNSKYTRLYNQVLPFVPASMRLTSIQATPVSETACQLNLSGIIKTNQQWADLSLALLRIPGARSVSRGGFNPQYNRVPRLTEEDQVGRITLAGEPGPLPLDPKERMDAIIGRAAAEPTGFQNVSNFGSTTISERGPMPEYTAVTATVLLDGANIKLPAGWDFNLLVPDALKTITGVATAAPAGAGAPGAPGGALGAAPATPAAATPAPAPAGGSDGANREDR